jgi:CRISPR-associated endonuclease Csn1
MSKILGLDLGTNSIGWAVVEKDGTDFSLVDKGVRIFSEGVKSEKGVESSRAAERTGFRSARKIKFRRKLRKYETLKVLAENNMCPLSVDEVVAWRKSEFKEYPLNDDFLKWLKTDDGQNINPYLFRDKASKGKTNLFELGRAFYHIAQRRGFLSNRLDQSAEGIFEEHCPEIEYAIEDALTVQDLKTEIIDYFERIDIIDTTGKKLEFKKDLDEGEKKLKSLFVALEKIIKTNENNFEKAKEEIIARLNRKEDLGAVKKKIGEISQAMKDGSFATLGQYFYNLYNKEVELENATTKEKEKFNRAKIRNQYTAREEHYLAEFEIICKAQNIEAINDTEVLPEKKYSGLAKDLYKAIFFQRPLKSQKGLIGKCSFEKSKSRCAVSHPDYEEYRMWTYINTIKIKTPEDEILRFLTAEERQNLVAKFLRKKDNFSFEDLARELIPKGATFDFYKSFNIKAAQYLFNYKPKDSVSGCVVSASFKNIFGEDWKTKTFNYQTKNGKGETVTRNVDYKDFWHLLSVATSDIYVQEYAKEKLGLDEKRAKSFSKIKLKKDFASLSLNAINKILPYVKEGLLYSHAVFMANIESIVDEKIWNDSSQRKYIQDCIAKIIETNTYDNGLLEVVNGLMKEYKKDGVYYSKEAETSFKNDLQKKLISFYKYHKIEANNDKILNDLFPVLIEQIKKQEYITVKRLDEKVLEFLSGENENGEIFCTNEKQLKKLYHPSDIEVFKKKIIKDENGNEQLVLGSPLTSSIKNPMAMRALHQLRKVLNALILEGQIDSKTIIHIEMARELNDANKRKGIQDFQNENKKARETYREEIKKLYFDVTKQEIEPTEDDLLRYQLWLEQDKKEIYEEGKSIGISQIIGNNPDYDIEHTVPRSRSQDNSLMNKTLCSQKFNRAVKKNQMPVELSNHEEIKKRVEHWQKEADKLTWEIDQIVKSTKAMATKEAKDKKIRYRHFLTLKRDYLKGKYDRFVWEEPKVGFKNSQIPDTGIITKYSQAYLKSYFNRVESVKGGMVAEFRKIWGVQKSYQENGKKYHEIKDRSKHTHHTIDAITMACMTKDKYDVLAESWKLEDDVEKENYRKVKELLADSKPWKTFTEDLVKIEEEILVSHYTPDNVKKQSKKVVRIRGKKQYVAELTKDVNGKNIPKKDANDKIIYKLDEKGNKIPRLQQGDTIRGSLHQDSIYGAIKNPLNTEEIRYVIRKDLESIKLTEIENIVDETVKEKVRMAKENGILVIPSNAQQKNKLNGTVWMNEEKGVPINKVRIYANSVKNPLEIKEHAAISKSRHEHKQKVYAQNDENYCMAIYDDGKNKDFELINNFNLAQLQKLGQGYYPLYKEKTAKGKTTQIPIAKRNGRDLILKRGQQVIFYDKEIENPLDVSEITDFTGRVYIIEGLSIQRIVRPTGKVDEYGVIMFRYFKEARKSDDIKKDNFKPDGNFKIGENKPTRKMNHNQFEAFVEGVDFRVLPSGKIEKV